MRMRRQRQRWESLVRLGREGWMAEREREWEAGWTLAERWEGERKRMWPWTWLWTDSRKAARSRVLQIAREALAAEAIEEEGKKKQMLKETMRPEYQRQWETEWRWEWEEIMNHGWRCGKVQLLPAQLPPSLQELRIAELPGTIEHLCNLEVLVLECSSLEKLPPSLSDLRNLKKLRLVDCHRLKCLPDSLGLLTELEVESCNGLVEVGTLPSTLIQLRFSSCHNLERINGLCGLAELQTLNMSGWRKLEELAGVETLVSLEQLRASGCGKLKRIQGLGQLTKLKLLDVGRCRELEELEGVEHLRSLEMLDAQGWESTGTATPMIEGRHALHLKMNEVFAVTTVNHRSAGELSLNVPFVKS